MPNKEKKQKVSSEASSESGVQKKKRTRKAPASDADVPLPDLPNTKSRAKKSTKAANNAKPLDASEEEMQKEPVEDTASEAGSQQTLSPQKSPRKANKGK